jgi:predicted esterase YcpF (UPF0227 family)
MTDCIKETSSPITIIYLHGFQSSSRSQKACALQEYLAEKNLSESFGFHSPDLPFSPVKTLKIIEKLVQGNPNVVLMGSSMGGFYAAYASQYFKCPAVLINPVADPDFLFDSMLGENLENPYTAERHTFVQADLDFLRSISEFGFPFAELIFCLLETGDEVLDYRLAEKKYKLCQQKIIEGGDHRFQSFEACLPEILHFYKNASCSK